MASQSKPMMHIKGDNADVRQKATKASRDISNMQPLMHIYGNNGQALNSAETARKSIANNPAYIKIHAFTGGLGTEISNALAAREFHVRVHGDVTTGGVATGTANARGGKAFNTYATGTQDWAIPNDQVAIVNELGNESIIRNGKWHKISGGAHFENLKKNDIILSANQTKAIEEAKAYDKGTISSYAKGSKKKGIFSRIASVISNVITGKSANTKEYNSWKKGLKQDVDYVKSKGVDPNKHQYGNIDTNNRQKIHWDNKTLKKNKSALQSWEFQRDEQGNPIRDEKTGDFVSRPWNDIKQDFKGTDSTVYGASGELSNGQQVAFSPIQQTKKGAVLLDRRAVYSYLEDIAKRANGDPK